MGIEHRGHPEGRMIMKHATPVSQGRRRPATASLLVKQQQTALADAIIAVAAHALALLADIKEQLGSGE